MTPSVEAPATTIEGLGDRIHRLALQQDGILTRLDALAAALEKVSLLEQRLPYELRPLQVKQEEDEKRLNNLRRDVDGVGKSLDTLRLEYQVFKATINEQQRNLAVVAAFISAIVTTLISQVGLRLMGM